MSRFRTDGMPCRILFGKLGRCLCRQYVRLPHALVRVALVAMLTAILWGKSHGTALADDICRDQAATEMALQKGMEAKQAQDAGDHTKALSLLHEAWRLCPHPKLLFLKARSLLALGRFAEAREVYRLIESNTSYFPQPEKLEEIQRGIQTCEEALHETLVTLSTPGVEEASLTVDGVAIGTSPATVRLHGGVHSVVASKPGHASALSSVSVGQEESLSVELVLVPDAPVPSGGASERSDGSQGESGTVWNWLALGSGAALLGTSAGFFGNYFLQAGKELAPNQRLEGDDWDIGVGSALAGAGVGLIVTSIWLWLDGPEVQP